MYMTTKIRKWGNSLAIRIPKYIIDRLGLKEGSLVDLDIKKIPKKKPSDPEFQITIIPIRR